LIAGFTLVIVVLVVLWLTAPQWEGPLRPNPSPPSQSFVSLNVTNWVMTGPAACWQGTFVSVGGTILVGGTFPASLSLPYPGGSTGPNCTARAVGVTTPGFALDDANVPVTVPPGGHAWLYANVTVPNAAYNGPLSITVTVASP
jgi:hypothetical protein